MKIYDVTQMMEEGMPVWPGEADFVLQRDKKIEEGADANVSRLEMSVHTGTHVDAPFHFLSGGDTVENLLLDVLIGSAQVVELPESVDEITRDVIETVHLTKGVERVLFKTRNSNYWKMGRREFQKSFVGIDADAAKLLVELGVRLVGIDYLSVAPFKRSRPTHEVLLGAKMVIIEGLDLSGVTEGEYMLYCLPLKLKLTDGAPARVVLVQG
jgi:arylformamidase